MASSEWLEKTLFTGESTQDAAPVEADAETVAVLRRAFARHAADVAGPPVPFDEHTASAAAKCLAAACWRIASGEAGPKVVMQGEPKTPAAHLSADVCLRLLPAVLRRSPHGPLADEVGAVLAAWPLSGSLAELDVVPANLDFGHPGLELLFAERLPAAPYPSWVPDGGRLRECVERVFAARGRPAPGSVE